MSSRYKTLRSGFVTKRVLVSEMHSAGRLGPPFRVLAGHTYREPVQVFNRCMMPVYQMAFRWTGNRLDAEDVTTWVLTDEFTRLDLPRPVPDVDEQLIEAAVAAIGKHWMERYGVSALRWSAFLAGEAAAIWRPSPSLRALLEALPAELRLVTVLRFLRRRTVRQIANQVGVSPAAGATLIFKALAGIAADRGLGPDVDDTSQASELATFVDHLIAKRRPIRFAATAASFPALLAATSIHASIAGNDLPTARFVRSLEEGVTVGGWPAA